MRSNLERAHRDMRHRDMRLRPDGGTPSYLIVVIVHPLPLAASALGTHPLFFDARALPGGGARRAGRVALLFLRLGLWRMQRNGGVTTMLR